MSDDSVSFDPEVEPPKTNSWTYHDGSDGDIPAVHGRFSNGWRFEIKPIDGQVFYSLAPPLAELDEWESPAVEDWSMIPFDNTLENLWTALHSADSLADLADADNFVVNEFGMVFEMLERENL